MLRSTSRQKHQDQINHQQKSSKPGIHAHCLEIESRGGVSKLKVLVSGPSMDDMDDMHIKTTHSVNSCARSRALVLFRDCLRFRDLFCFSTALSLTIMLVLILQFHPLERLRLQSFSLCHGQYTHHLVLMIIAFHFNTNKFDHRRFSLRCKPHSRQ